MNFFAQRRHTLVRGLTRETESLDAFLVTAGPNVAYLTGVTGDAGYFVATPKNGVVVTDARFEDQVKDECPDVTKGGTGVELHVRPHDKTTPEAAVEVLTKAGAKTVGVEGNRLTWSDLEALRVLAPKITFVPQTNLIEAQRVVKDPSEIEHVRAAIRVAERAFKMFVATLEASATEKELADALDGYLRRAGAKAASFPPIVAVGERGALPHAVPTSLRLGEGSKLLVDFGADTGYMSDITRVVRSPFVMTPTRKNKFERVGYDLEEVYQVVLNAQSAALAAIRPGVMAKDVDAAARKVIASARLKSEPAARLGDFFSHGLGHGIGLEIHEAPRVRANSEDILEAGMIITVEPGVYIPGWGGVRIEDDVLVTRDGCTLLTTLSRELSTAG